MTNNDMRPYTKFGETRMLPVKVYVDGKFVDNQPIWDEVLWVERGEDWYAFSSRGMKGKRVRVIERSSWIKAKEEV